MTTDLLIVGLVLLGVAAVALGIWGTRLLIEDRRAGRPGPPPVLLVPLPAPAGAGYIPARELPAVIRRGIYAARHEAPASETRERLPRSLTIDGWPIFPTKLASEKWEAGFRQTWDHLQSIRDEAYAEWDAGFRRLEQSDWIGMAA
jgi:hypothetical protein